MAANDKNLTFAVQIVEDDRKNIESVIHKVQLMLDKEFKLKVSDEGSVKKLEEMLNVLKSVETQMGTISKGLSSSSWGKLGDELNIAIAEFRKLTSSAEEFGRTMSRGFASNLRDEINSIVSQLPKLTETAKLLNKVKDESRKSDGSGGIVEGAVSISNAELSYKKLYELAEKIHYAADRMGDKGLNTDSLLRYKQQLSEIYTELDKIRKSQDGLHPVTGLTTSEYLKSVGWNDTYRLAEYGLKSLEEAEKVMNGMATLADKIANRLNDISATNPLRSNLETARQDLELWQSLIARNPTDLGKDAIERNQKMQEYNQLLADALQKEAEIQRTTVAQVNSRNEARKELDATERKIAEIESLISKMRTLGIDTVGIEKAYTELEKLRHSYQLMAAGNGNFAAFKADSETVAIERNIAEAVSKAKKEIKEEERALRTNEQAKNRAEKESQKLSAEEQKLANAMKQTTQSASRQSSVLNDLKSMATQYLSVWGASSFVQSMAQITGELELQQKSLEVIIGSASYASQLFGEIRDLSQQSPYTFQDLLKSTRQLAAFGIETKDLYGTMKSLSDIGAGLSVDVQRLILAYGHTKSYGYLSGIQNRQFETAGIDLVGALADRYNKLADAEERAGRAAEHVTRKDVFKKISKKEVSFDDVNAVIMGLDAPGGKFYNMQERQFETLGGKLRNLRNNYNIMMAEMGKANHGMLMSGVNMLNELTEHWDKYAHIITSILVPLGALKLATLAVNGAVGAQSDAMAKNAIAMAKNQKATAAAISAMQPSKGFGWGAAIRSGWSKSGSFNPSKLDKNAFAKMLNEGYANGSISKSHLMMMGTSNKLEKVYREIALSIAEIDRKQIKAIASAKGWERVNMRLKYSLGMAAASIRSFGAAIASMAWQMAPMAIIGGIVAVISHFKSMAGETKDALDQLASNAKEDAKSIDEVIGRYSSRGVSQTGGTSYLNGNRIQGKGLSFDTEKIKEMTAGDLEELKQELQKYSPFYEGDLVDIGKFESQAEQIMAIMRKLDSYRHAEQVLAANAGNYDQSAGGSFWGGYESFTENLEEMGKALSKAGTVVASLSDKEIDDIDKELGGVLKAAMNSGAATSEAEAFRQYLVRAMFMSEEDRKELEKSWSDGIKKAYYEATNKRYYTDKGTGFFVGTSRWWGLSRSNVAHNLNGKNAESHIESYRNSVSRLSDSLRKDINRNYGANDIGGALKHAIEVYEQFAADAKNVSEEAKQAGLDMLLEETFGDGSKQRKAYEKKLNADFAGEVLKEVKSKGNINPFMSPEEIKKSVEPIIKDVEDRWKKSGKKVNRITKETTDGIVTTVINANKLSKNWQEKLAGIGGESLWKNFYRFNSEAIKGNTGEADMWDAIRKRYKELQGKLDREKKVMQVKFGINLTPEIFMDSKKILEQIKKLNKNNAFYKDKNGKWQVSHKNTGASYDEYVERYLPLMNTFSELYYDQKGAEERNVQLYDDKKDKGGHGTYKDKEAEVWEQRIKLIQEARREYDYWEKKVGKKAAQDKVKKQFENLVGVDKVLKPGDLDNLEKYADVLRNINKEVSERYKEDKRLPKGQKKDTNIANDIKVMRELDNALYNIDKSEFERKSEEFVSQLSFGLDELTRKWQIFDAIREKIGNDNVSARMAGLAPLGGSNGTFFKSDAMKAEIEAAMREFAPNVDSIDFSMMLGMDEESITNRVQEMFRAYTDAQYKILASEKATNAEKENAKKQIEGYESRIHAVVNALKKWQQAEKDVQVKAQEAYAAAVDKAMDYASEIERINTSLNEQIALIEKAQNVGNGEKQGAIARLKANAEMEKEQASGQYGRFFNSIFSESRKAMSDYADKLRGLLNKQFKTGAISAQNYADKLKDIEDKMNEFDGEKFSGSLGKGLEQIFRERYNEGYEKMSEGVGYQAVGRNAAKIGDSLFKEADTYEFSDHAKAMQLRNQGMSELSDGIEFTKMGGEMAAMGEGMMNGAGDAMKAIKIIDQIVHAINDMVQSMKEIKDDLYETIDSFGGDLDSDAAINAGAFFDGFAEASEGATKAWDSLKSGNPVGVVQGVIQSFTGWFKAFNAAHDKKREVEIQRLEKDVTKIENTLNTIRDLREYELGYGKGNNIRALLAYYNGQNQSGKDGQANKGMAEYYSRAATGASSSYAMEYNLLLEERKKKMQQYNEEADKKKKDDTKLEEYKKEIAELDEQVQQFAENLMNELWGIDFKGWASQISDALMTAFENGTSAADAFKDTMEDIMRGVVKNMINLAVIEPFINRLKERLIGENGVINDGNREDFMNHPEKYTDKIVGEMGKWYETDGTNMVTAASEIYDGMNDLLKQYGIALDNKYKSSGSNSISQTITEETAGYMSGILAAMHQDGSVRRLQLQTLVAEQMPNVIEMMTVNGGHIAGIDENTRAIMHMMQDGSGRMYERIDYIGTKLDRFASGFDKITVS